MTTTDPDPARRVALGAVGGALWALSPVPWLIADLRELDRGTVSFAVLLVLVAATHVAGPALLAAASTGLGAVLGRGRTLATGVALSAVGLTAVAVGNAFDVGALAVPGEPSVVGYVVFYLGFLTALLGALLVGVVVIRRRRDPAARTGGWVLALAIPLGIGIGASSALALPDTEAGFLAAVAVPTGIAWLLLGRSLPRAAAPSPARVPTAS